MSDFINDTELHAYIDNQLTPEQKTELEKRLEKDPLAKKKLAEFQQITQSMQRIFQPVYNEPVPEHLLNRPCRNNNNIIAIAASLLFFIVGSFTGWQFNRLTDTAETVNITDSLISPAVFSHSIYTEEKLHPVEVKTEQQEHLNLWLSKRLKTKLRAPDLAQYDFQLVGGRLLPSTQQRMAAQYMYQNEQGERITLYIRRGYWNESGNAITYEKEKLKSKQYDVTYWTDGDLGYVLTSQQGKGINKKLTEEIYQQMSLQFALLVAFH
jgi:anti-sigma factor RsiW